MSNTVMFDQNGNPVQVVPGMEWYARQNGYRDAPQPPKPDGWYSRISRFGPDDFPPGTNQTAGIVSPSPS